MYDTRCSHEQKHIVRTNRIQELKLTYEQDNIWHIPYCK